jgi:hypothetical protein
VDEAACQDVILRAALYVDGFNLYHPIDQSGENHLKWISLWKLGELLSSELGCQIAKVVLCTAVPRHLPDKRDRHNTFNNAQIAQGVHVIKGHHVPEPDRGCYSEKQSDIHVALSVILDGIDDVYDVAILLSADSDQVATARTFKDRLAVTGKRLVGAVPLERSYPTDYPGLGVKVLTVTKHHLEACVMPASLPGKKGTINRPEQYAPPEGWVHPDDRPKGRPPRPPKKKAWSKAVRV